MGLERTVSLGKAPHPSTTSWEGINKVPAKPLSSPRIRVQGSRPLNRTRSELYITHFKPRFEISFIYLRRPFLIRPDVPQHQGIGIDWELGSSKVVRRDICPWHTQTWDWLHSEELKGFRTAYHLTILGSPKYCLTLPEYPEAS